MAKESAGPGKKRRPYRRQQILTAAAELFHRNGYYATGMNDIGAATGITGPGIYRHFASKEEILSVLINDTGTKAVERARAAIEQAPNDETALDGLIDNYISTVIANRALIGVFLGERRALRSEARSRLDHIDRKHVEEWVNVLHRLRPELSNPELRFMIHAALGLVIFTTASTGELTPDVEARLLKNMMSSVLSCEPR